MTVDDWRVKYEILNAETDRLRAEVERLREDAAQKRVQDCETRMMRYAIQLAEMQAERDAARAGEARAVEALRAVVAGAYPLDNQPSALDWLDQQRRKAAAEALEEFAYDADGIEELITIFDLRSALRTRAAALRAGEVGND